MTYNGKRRAQTGDASSGAFNTPQHLGLDDWPEIAASYEDQLAELLLRRCRAWEAARTDPRGQVLPAPSTATTKPSPSSAGTGKCTTSSSTTG